MNYLYVAGAVVIIALYVLVRNSDYSECVAQGNTVEQCIDATN